MRVPGNWCRYFIRKRWIAKQQRKPNATQARKTVEGLKEYRAQVVDFA
jgi:hypothetical protein